MLQQIRLLQWSFNRTPHPPKNRQAPLNNSQLICKNFNKIQKYKPHHPNSEISALVTSNAKTRFSSFTPCFKIPTCLWPEKNIGRFKKYQPARPLRSLGNGLSLP